MQMGQIWRFLTFFIHFFRVSQKFQVVVCDAVELMESSDGE